MLKKILVCAVCMILTFVFFVFADDSVTITTYYPSPYGRYHELSTDRLSIGADNDPAADGVINFKNLSSDPTQGHEGALYYNSATDKFKYYNGSQWKDVGEQDVVWFGGYGIHLKDGATANASCSCGGIPFGAAARYSGGNIQTAATACGICPGANCTSGWVNGYNASCTGGPNGYYGTLIATATTSSSGVKIDGQKIGGIGGNCTCSAQGSWQ